MIASRRTLLGGLLATLAAPAIIRTPVRVVRSPRVLMRITNGDMRAALARFNNGNPFIGYMNAGRYPRVYTMMPTELAASGRIA